MKQHNSLWRAATLLSFVLALVFVSCFNPMEPGALSGVPVAAAGKASVHFAVLDAAARTVLPDIRPEALSYTLTGKRGEGAEEELAVFSGSGTNLALEPGEWSFTLNALNADKDIVFTANTSATLTVDHSSEVVFTLKPLKEGTGAVNISFTYPAYAGISAVTKGGDISAAGTVTLNPTSAEGTYQAADIAAGDYFATFSFYRGAELAAVVSETIQVRAGLTSKKTISISGINLNPGLFTYAAGDTLAAKLQWIADNAASDTNYLVEVRADEAIVPTILGYDGKTGISITLTGGEAEQTISLSATGSMFDVRTDVTLALDNNITLSGRADNTDSLVRVNTGGTLVLNNGAKITGNTSEYGGGVFVLSDGTFTMNNGVISGNTSDLYGGGVSVSSDGTFTMNNGKVSGNTASSGGGVSGSITMNGGAISGNTATGYGGGMDINSDALFTMNGGKISGNIASTNGGGVSVSGTFTMTGGVISGNTATTNGGGIYIEENVTFSKTGGVIYGNEKGAPLANTASRGHAVYWNTLPLYRDRTLGAGDSISTADTGTGWDRTVPASVPIVNGWNHSDIEAGGEQWFTFAASAANQYIHAKFGTLIGLNMSVYDSGFQPVGTDSLLYGGIPYKSLSGLSAGQTYYVKVTPAGSLSGGYDIMVGESPLLEGTEVTALASGWNPGTIASMGNEWFTFTASAASQFMHVKFGTLGSTLIFEVYDSALQSVGSIELNGSTGSMNYKNLSGLSAGQTYYVMARPYSPGPSGNYEIAVTETLTPPGTEVTELESGWNPGSIAVGVSEWFTFTASAESQYVHFKAGMANTIVVYVFDSAWQAVGGGYHLYNWQTLGSLITGLSADETYYLMVMSTNYSSGDYELALNESFVPPGIEVTELENDWKPGSVAAGGAEWFSFTASAESQYVHFKTVTHNGESHSMEVFDNAGKMFNNVTYIMSNGSNKIIDFNAGQTYYINIKSNNNGSGDFELAVNDSTTPPPDSP